MIVKEYGRTPLDTVAIQRPELVAWIVCVSSPGCMDRYLVQAPGATVVLQTVDFVGHT